MIADLSIVKSSIILCIFLSLSKLISQDVRKLNFCAGPSLTNIQEVINGEKQFFTSPERPYYSIQYHFGILIEEPQFLNHCLGIKYGLIFDKRSSSNTSFNKYLEDSYGFIGLPLELDYKPLKNKNIRFEVGFVFQYLVNSKYAFMKPFKNYEFDYIIGIQFMLLNKIYLATRFLEPLIFLREKGNVIKDPNIPNERRLYKTHSAQLSLIYKLDLE